MVTATTLQLELPRISSNQLGRFVFSSEAQKWAILWDMKFGNPFSSPYYQAALNGILGAFNAGRFDEQHVLDVADELLARTPKGPNDAHRLRNNAEMLRRFVQTMPRISIPAGGHRIIRRNALMEVDGVVISVRPEIITQSSRTGMLSFTKFRFSKDRASLDASEIVLLLLLHYAREPIFHAEQLDLENTLLVDCYSREVIQGHHVPRVRQPQLRTALADIRRIWPLLEQEDPGGRDFRRHQFRN